MRNIRRRNYCRPIENLEDRKLMSGEKILFIRGADRSGAGLGSSPTDAQRTEQLSDINNTDESAGNHGWGQLKSLLTSTGYSVSQLTESVENGAPGTGLTQGHAIDLTGITISQYSLVVFGSNNATDYTKASIDAVDAYIRGGGSALFISDGNWGGGWTDAAASDQQFLDRYGWTMTEDQNQGTRIFSRSGGDFIDANNAILTNVDNYQAEGTSPIRVGNPSKKQTNIPLGKTKEKTRLNDGSPGTLVDPASNDYSLVVANVASGRIAGFTDRNGWFNGNGSGTDLGKGSNQTLALNLFSWLAKGSVDQNAAADAISVAQPGVAPFRALQIGFNQNLGASISKDDFVIKKRNNNRVLAGQYWKFSTFLDSQGRTVMQARVTKDDIQGKYKIIIINGSITGTSGVPLNHEITLGFFLSPITSGSSEASATVPGTVLTGKASDTDGVFADDASVLA